MSHEMTTRDWVEYGKMFEKLLAAGYLPTLVPNKDGKFYVSLGVSSCTEKKVTSIQLMELTETRVWAKNPLEAMKSVYAPLMLEKGETEFFVHELVLPAPVLEAVYRASDAEGIPADELILSILKERSCNGCSM